MTNEDYKAIAIETVNQLGGHKLLAMTGTKIGYYNDMLVPMFEQETGLYTSLGSMGR
jgi:hypothetical protein